MQYKTKSSRLRVLIATPRAFPFMGGVENHVYQVATRMARSGIDVTVVSGDTSGDLPKVECVEGVTMRRVPVWPRGGDFYFSPDFYRVIKAGHPDGAPWDLVHIQNYLTFCAPVAMLGAMRAKVPYVITFHGGGHPSRLRNTMRNVQRLMLKPLMVGAARYIVTARFEFAQFGDWLGLNKDRFLYIPNGSDISLPKHATDSKVGVTPGLILSIGRLESHKGHHRVIAAMPHVLQGCPQAQLHIVGFGPQEDELKQLVQTMNLSQCVKVYGIPATQRHAMVDLLARASLVTLLSEYETHPMALLEALAMGKSALIADTSGLSEIARDGFARAIPLNHPAEQTAAAILEQLRNPIHPKPVQLPTWDDCTNQLIDMYHHMLARPKPVFSAATVDTETTETNEDRILVGSN